MFTIFTLFSTLTTKHRLRVKGESKQTPDPNNSTAPGLRPPVLIFLDPPLKVICDISQLSLYRMPEHTVILMAREGLPPGFTRLKLMNPSVDPNVMSASILFTFLLCFIR